MTWIILFWVQIVSQIVAIVIGLLEIKTYPWSDIKINEMIISSFGGLVGVFIAILVEDVSNEL